MLILGKSPKEARARIRAALEPGPYIGRPGKKKVWSPHQPGKCDLLGVDNMDHTFAGNAMPKRAEFDGVCRLCARDGVRDGEDSCATVSLPSSPEGSHLWPPPVYAGPRLAARVGPRPTVAIRIRESVRLRESINRFPYGVSLRVPGWRSWCLGVCGWWCLCCVCVGALVAPLVPRTCSAHRSMGGKQNSG